METPQSPALCLPLLIPRSLATSVCLHGLAPGVSRAAECATPKYASPLKDYFELVAFEKPQSQEKLWKRRGSPFVREIYIRKGVCTRKKALSPETSAGEGDSGPHLSSPPSWELSSSPAEPRPPSQSWLRRVYRPQLPGSLLNPVFLGLPYHHLKFFSSCSSFYGREGEGEMSQPRSRRKTLFPPLRYEGLKC